MKDIEKYKEWLEAQGAVILTPTNEWEVLRYQKDGVTRVIYRNKKNRFRFVYGADDDYERFETQNDGWQAPVVLTATQRKVLRNNLFERDGNDCWYCGEFLSKRHVPFESPDFPTIEHLVPQSEGGTHAMANLVLAHQSCNGTAANAPLAAKIELRHSLLAKHEQTPPWESVRA